MKAGRLVRSLVVATVALAACAAEAQDAATLRAEKAGVVAARAAAEAEFAERKRECQSRFAVNACVDRAMDDRRAELARLRARELAIDTFERQQRAAERRAEIERKEADGRVRDAERAARAASAPPSSADAPTAQRQPRQPRRRVDDAPRDTSATAAPRARPREPRLPKPRISAETRAAREAESLAAYERRQRKAAADREAAAARAARRDADGKTAAPLPIPR